jgi:hypothetical protein
MKKTSSTSGETLFTVSAAISLMAAGDAEAMDAAWT